MAVAGTLEVQMFANVARLTSDMASARSTVGGAMADINKSVGAAKSMLASLGIGLGVGYFANLIKGSIDALDKINDLSKTTAIAVDLVAGLGVAAKQSGGDLESIAKSINKLSVNMGKDTEKFHALGVTAKEPLEAFKQLADIFVALDDPQQRSAVMAQALGKAWEGAAPLLAEGGARIGEMVEKGRALSGVTAENTKAADDFNDKWVLLVGTGGLLTKLITPLLPLLNTLADNMLAAQEKSTGLSSSFGVLLETGKAIVILFGTIGFAVKGVGIEIGGLAAQFAATWGAQVKFMTGDFKGAIAELKGAFGDGGIGDRMKADGVKARAEFDAWEKGIMKIGSALWVEEQRVAGVAAAWKKYYADEAAGANKAATAKKAAAFLDDGKAAKAAADATKKYEAELLSLNEQLAKLNGTGEREIYLLKLASDAFKGLTETQKQVLLGKKELIIALEVEAKWVAEVARLHTAALEAQMVEIDARDDLINSMQDNNAQLKIEAATLGMTDTERRVYLLNLEKEQALKHALTGKDREYIKGLAAESQGIIESNAALTSQISMWESLGNTFGDWITSFKDGWKSGMDYARNALKNLLADLIAFFAKKWLLSVVAGGSFGSSAASAATSALGSMGTSLIGTGIRALGGLFGVGAAAGGGVSAGTTIGGLTMGVPPAGGGIVSSITAGLRAIPGWGWIAIAALAAFAFFGGKGGGPKKSGTGIYDVDQTGAVTPGPMSDIRRFYNADDKSLDAGAASIAKATAESYAAIAKSLGVLGSQVTITSSVDTDPQGKASDRVATQAFVNGFKIFEQKNESIGRDAAKTSAEAELQAKRALLAALQGSTLPEYLAKILNPINAAGAALADIDAALNTALAAKAAFDSLAQSMTAIDDAISILTGDSLEAFKKQLTSLSDTVKTAADNLASSITKGDAGEIQKAQDLLAQSIINRYQTEMKLIGDIVLVIGTVKQNLYDFRIANAQRINAVGGNVNIGGIASGRMSELRPDLLTGTPEARIASINQYVGAVGTWLSSTVDGIRAKFAQQLSAQQEAASAIAQAQQSAINAQIQGLQQQLSLAQAWVSVLGAAESAIDKMRLTTASPASLLSRLTSSGDDVQALLAQYRASNGESRVALANQLIEAVGTRQGLGQESFQRPGDEYTKLYNENISIYSEIKGDARNLSQRQHDIESQIAALQATGNALTAQVVDNTSQMQQEIDAANAAALDYYTYAGTQFENATELQLAAYDAQLFAITGGVEVSLYSANRLTETVDELRTLNKQIADFVGKTGGTIGAGEDSGASGSISGGGQVIKDQPIVIKIGEQTFANATLRVITNNGRVVKTTVEQS